MNKTVWKGNPTPQPLSAILKFNVAFYQGIIPTNFVSCFTYSIRNIIRITKPVVLRSNQD